MIASPPTARAVLLKPDSKHPIDGRSWKRAPNPAELEHHKGNFGCRTGKPEGAMFDLWALDFDFKADGLRALALLERDHGPIPGRRVKTGGGGLHIYLAGPHTQRSCKLPVRPGLDVELKAEGAYLVAPGATHPSGAAYAAEKPSSWSWEKFPPAPEWLVKLAHHPAVAPQRKQGMLGAHEVSPDVYVPALTGSEINSQHKALCPNHADTVPTLHVYPDHWYCSACEIGGRIRQLAAIVLGIGAQRGHTWKVESLEERKVLDKYLAKRFPEATRTDGGYVHDRP